MNINPANLSEALAQFHFLRPLWLLAVIPAFALAMFLWQRKGSAANWRAAIAPDLIDYLLESAQQLRPQWPWLLFAGWLLAAFALAGPTWEKLPQPVLQKRDGLVIVLDLSLSMYAEDIKPSRLQRARFKVLDILQKRREGLTGLVVYSGDAHVVSPLTDDTATIANLVPSLAPAMMPSFGSNVVAGIDTALQLLKNSGFERGRILLISDEIAEADIDKIAARIDNSHWQLAAIGVGTEQGAPIPLPVAGDQPRNANQSGFLKQDSGTIAIAQLHRERFAALAAKVSGRYDDIRIDDNDIDRVLPPVATRDDSVRTVEREFDQWRERGPQFVMLLLPLAAFAFRRGWLLLLFLMPFSPPSHAWDWQDLQWNNLWQRPDQQAQRDFDAGNSKAAAEKFQNPNWRAAAQYRSGDFEHAAQSLDGVDSADAHYNRGNALAHTGKLQDAISAYDAALKKNPNDADAKFNRDLVEKLLKQQQQKNQDNNSSQDQKKGQQQDQQQSASQNQPQGGDSKQSSQSQQSQQQNQSGEQGKNDQQSGQAANQQNQNQSPNDAKNSQQNQAQASQPKPSDQQAQSSEPNSQPSQTDASKLQSARESKDADKQDQENNSQQVTAEQLSPEQQRQQRATEQWLRQIPDDPSGLLRRKFLYEHRQREQQPQDDGKPIW